MNKSESKYFNTALRMDEAIEGSPIPTDPFCCYQHGVEPLLRRFQRNPRHRLSLRLIWSDVKMIHPQKAFICDEENKQYG